MIPNDTIPQPAQQDSSTHTNPVVMETKQNGTAVTAIRGPQLNLQLPDDLQRQTAQLDDRDEIVQEEHQEREAILGISQTSTPLTFTVTATRPPVLLKPDALPTVEFISTTQPVPDSSSLQQHSDSTTASPSSSPSSSSSSSSSQSSSQMQTTMQESPPFTTTDVPQTTSAVGQSERTVTRDTTSVPSLSSTVTSPTEDISLFKTEPTTLPPKSIEIVNIIPPKQTTQPTPVTLNFIYNRHTPPSSPPPPSTSPSTTSSSSSTVRTTSPSKVRTPPPNPVPPKPVPSYDVLTTPRAITTTPNMVLNSTTMLAPGGPPMAEAAAGVMGLGSGAEIGIAAGSIVAFWLLLGPLVCLICRLRERAAKTRSGGGVEDNALTRSGDDELGHRLVEEMIRLELARGRHKLYKTSIQDEHETERLGDVGSEYVNTEYLHNIVQNDYAKNSMDRRDSCEKLPLCNGSLKEPLYENTSKVPPPPPPPPPPKLDTSPMYANTTVDSPHVSRASNGYVCSNNYPLSSAALHLAKSRQNYYPPTNILRSPESEPVDGFMYSPRLLQRQLERAVRAEQKLHLKDGMRRSEKIFPKENFNVRAEPKIHTKAGLVNGYSKLPTNLPKVSIEGSIPNSPRIMHKDITEEEEEEEEETEIDRNLPKSMSLSHSVERSIPLLNGEKYRITSSNPSIDSGKYMICNKTPSRTRSMERNGLKRIDLSSVDRNGSDPWKKPLQQNGIDARKKRENSVDDTCSSLSSSPPSEEPEIQNNSKKLCDQGTQTLADTIASPWIGYRRPGVKDTVV